MAWSFHRVFDKITGSRRPSLEPGTEPETPETEIDDKGWFGKLFDKIQDAKQAQDEEERKAKGLIRFGLRPREGAELRTSSGGIVRRFMPHEDEEEGV